MMYPEMMSIVVKQHHEYLRNLAKPEPLVPTFADLGRSTRRQLGTVMIRLGVLLGGQIVRPAAAAPSPKVSFQK